MVARKHGLWRWTDEHTTTAKALADQNYCVKAAAHALGVSLSCLYWRSRKMGIPFNGLERWARGRERWTRDRICVLERHAQSGLTRREAAAVMGVKKSAVDRAVLRYLIDWPHSNTRKGRT